MTSGFAGGLLAPLNERSRSPEREHALRLLLRHGLPVRQVVGVDVDSVLYVTADGRARTAWLTVFDATLVIHDEAGFAVEPPAYAATVSHSPMRAAHV